MSKYIKIKVEGILPIPPEVQDSLDAAAERGLEVFKGLLRMQVGNIVPGTITGSWQSMPSSWNPPRQKGTIEQLHDRVHVSRGLPMEVVDGAEGQVSLTGGEVGRVTHPWDQGLWIFPTDHPLHDFEAHERAKYENPQDKDHLKPQLKETVRIAAESFDAKQKELEAGDAEESSD